MKIEVSSGLGTGPTKLAAFDAALADAGVANYNLLTLSSVIPPGSKLKPTKKANPGGNWGDRLYVVMAEERIDTPNTEAWAGLGWVLEGDTGKGLFVEHHGHCEATVRRDICESLKLMAVRAVDFGEIQVRVQGGVCKREPICALVVAVFKHEAWNN